MEKSLKDSFKDPKRNKEKESEIEK